MVTDVSNRTARDLGTLLVHTGVQTLHVRESFERFEQLGVDWRLLLREYGRWREALPTEPDSIPFSLVKATRAVGGLDLMVAVDTRAGAPEHGCLVDAKTGLERPLRLPVVVSVPMASDADAAEVTWRPLTLGTFALEAGEAVNEVTVILDIGNSRTTVGVLEAGSGAADLSRDLTLVPLGARGASAEHCDTIAESMFELVAPEWASDRQVLRHSKRRQSRVREPWQLFRDPSPARVGREARRLRFESGFRRGLRTGMSSPKRYLWSRAPVDGAWFGHDRHGAGEPVELAARLLRVLKPQAQAGASSIPSPPRSDMMAVFVFELLAQAFTWINSPVYRHARADARRRRIARVLLTFPSGMVAEEVAIYEARARQAIDALDRLVLAPGAGQPPELVEMYLDEGSAAQLAFVSEQVAGGASGWREWTDRVGGSDGAVRIGCLDIGGGSIDASAVQYRLDPDVMPFHLDCEPLHIDGVSRGGDDVVKALIERLLIPALARQMNCERCEFEALVYADPRAGEDAMVLAARIIQGLLYPLALEVLRAAEGAAERISIPIGSVAAVDSRLLVEIPRAFEASGSERVYAPLQTALVELTRRQLEAVIEATIGGVLGSLAQALVKEGCHVIVFAGWLSVLDSIVDIASAATGWPRERLLPMHRNAGFCRLAKAIPGASTAAVDPKLAVLIGAAVSECARTNRTMNGVKLALSRERLRRRGHFWGIVTAKERCFKRDGSLLFRPGADAAQEASTRQLTGAAFVGRRLTASSSLEANPVYELLPRAAGSRRHDLCFRLRRDAHLGEETIALSAGGESCDESQGPVRFRLKTIFTDEYWLDGNMGRLETSSEVLHSGAKR